MIPPRQSRRPAKPRAISASRIAALSVLATGALVSTSAHAYLDPGSGSMLLQIILGGIGGLVVLVKLYWHRLLVLLGRAEEDNNDMVLEEASEQPEDDTDR